MLHQGLGRPYKGITMTRRLVLGCFVALVGAASGAPDALLFVRDGRVMYQPAGATTARQAVTDDPGWTYVIPTWASPSEFMVMRLKGGQPNRSHVGLVERVSALPVKPSQVDWMSGLAGCYTMGFGPRAGLAGMVKLKMKGEEAFDVYLTLGAIASEWGPSQRVAKYGMGGISDVPTRLHFSPDKRYMTIPSFPTDVSATVDLYDLKLSKVLRPLWLNPDWMRAHHADADVSCVAWLSNTRLVLGTMTSGLYLYDGAQKTVSRLDTWEPGKARIRNLSLSADNQRIYYDVEVYEGEKSRQEIRLVSLGGRPTVIATNASAPDAAPSDR